MTMASSGKRWRRLTGPLVALAALLIVFTGVGNASAATLISDDFEDANAAGWTTTGGTWIVNMDGSNHVLRQSSFAANALARTGSASLRDYGVYAEVKPQSFNGLPGWAGVVARGQSTSNYYALVVRPDDTVAITRTVNGTTVTLASKKLTVDTGTWYNLTLFVSGTKLSGYANDVSLSATDGIITTGQPGLVTNWTSASFDTVVVTD
jgi:hypothetical protein